MEKQLIIITSEKELRETFEKMISEKGKSKTTTDFNEDRLTWNQAAKFANMSIPTLRRRVKDGLFKVHGSGRKNFLLKSEIIEALKNHA